MQKKQINQVGKMQNIAYNMVGKTQMEMIIC